MNFASPSIAYTTTPLEALFQAHQRASTIMAVYLIGGGALATAALLAWSWQLHSPLQGAWQAMPMVLSFVAVVWMAVGVWVLQRQHAQVQLRERRYRETAERNTFAAAATRGVAARARALPSDAPWELLAFFNAPAQRAPARHATATAPACAPTGPRLPAATAGQACAADAHLAVQGQPLRPVSLFGAYDGA